MVSADMDFPDRLKELDEHLKSNNEKLLSATEKEVLKGISQDMTYEEMAAETGLSSTYLRSDVAAKLFSRLSNLGSKEKVGKKNCRRRIDEICRSRHFGEVNVLGNEEDRTEVFSKLGLVSATGSITEYFSTAAPIQCMKKASNSLRFMGVFGNKWVNEKSGAREHFIEMLQRVSIEGGSVDFLLFNPATEEGENFRIRRKIERIDVSSFDVYRELSDRFDCLNVRLYYHSPNFRLIFYDGKELVMSRYRLDPEAHARQGFGWKAPHLIFDSNSDWPLYYAFEEVFSRAWSLEERRDSKKTILLEDFFGTKL
jgi:hypothetical protein